MKWYERTSITKHAHSDSSVTVRFNAVTADEIPENQRYHRWTPSGSIEMQIDNPAAAEQFQLGKSYYADFTAA